MFETKIKSKLSILAVNILYLFSGLNWFLLLPNVSPSFSLPTGIEIPENFTECFLEKNVFEILGKIWWSKNDLFNYMIFWNFCFKFWFIGWIQILTSERNIYFCIHGFELEFYVAAISMLIDCQICHFSGTWTNFQFAADLIVWFDVLPYIQ